jgi:predicted component of type VI protein secretion system
MSFISRRSALQVRLEVAHNRANVKRVVLQRDTLIGRSTQCNLRIASKLVSRRHCKITLNGRQVFVRDLQSSNGTFIDGRRIDAEQDVPLDSGSELSIGGVKFVVHYDAPPADAKTASNGHATNGSNAAVAAVAGAAAVPQTGRAPAPPAVAASTGSRHSTPAEEPPDVALEDDDVMDALPVGDDASEQSSGEILLASVDTEDEIADLPVGLTDDSPDEPAPAAGMSDDDIADFLSEMPSSSSGADEDLGDFLNRLEKD